MSSLLDEHKTHYFILVCLQHPKMYNLDSTVKGAVAQVCRSKRLAKRIVILPFLAIPGLVAAIGGAVTAKQNGWL